MLPQVMPEVINAISVDVKTDFISVCNNAAWCAGEISLKHQAAMEPYVQPLMERLVPLLLNPKVARSLTENAAVTIGRLALVCPQAVAPALSVFIKHWCEALAEIKDNDEKDSAFRGICMAIQANPSGIAEVSLSRRFMGLAAYIFALQAFGAFLNALVRWRTPSAELSHMFRSVSYMTRVLQSLSDHLYCRSCMASRA